MKKSKPTNKEVKTVINNILIEMSYMQQNISGLDSALGSYISFKGDTDKWGKWLEKEKEKADAKSKQSKGK